MRGVGGPAVGVFVVERSHLLRGVLRVWAIDLNGPRHRDLPLKPLIRPQARPQERLGGSKSTTVLGYSLLKATEGGYQCWLKFGTT